MSFLIGHWGIFIEFIECNIEFPYWTLVIYTCWDEWKMLIFRKIRETSCFGLLRTNLTGNELSKENIFYKHFQGRWRYLGERAPKSCKDALVSGYSLENVMNSNHMNCSSSSWSMVKRNVFKGFQIAFVQGSCNHRSFLRFTLAFKLRNVVAFMQFPTLTHELSMNCDIVSPHNLKSLVCFGIT